MPTPTPEQQQVRDKHFDSLLISKAEKIVMKDKKGDLNFLSQFCISTTKHSEALIVIEGCKDQLPYNHRSVHDRYNPWLITGYVQISKPEFFTQLNEYWENLQVPADWTICPFRVYEWNGNKWVARDLQVDLQNKVVRVRIRDQTFWSHPPRPFEVLENACGDDYKQKKGNLKQYLTSFQEVDTNSRIPEDQKPQGKTKKKTDVKKTFNEIYELVDNLGWDDHSQLTSYRYPTLQMAINTTYTPTAPDQSSQDTTRYGNDSSGVYEANSNEAHYRFEKEGTEPIPKPTKEVLWNWVVKSFNIDNLLAYEDVFEE